jgi:c(7)-type cytochrome triheme protein
MPARRAMVGLLAVVALVAAARADAPRSAAIGFDHIVHARDVDVAGQPAIACTHCHAVGRSGQLVGKPGHDGCFVGCHGGPPARPRAGETIAVAPDRVRVCTACHAEKDLRAPFAGVLRVPYPPYTSEQDFNVAFGHKKHAPVDCVTCHTKHRAEPHARCACHLVESKTLGPVARCELCHTPAMGKPQPPELAVLRDTVEVTFAHDAHAVRGGRGRECATCHAAIRTTDGPELPRPTVTDCATAGCHDGRVAFATTTACTRCHATAPERFTVTRPSGRFVHAGGHAGTLDQPCTSCHPIVGGEVTRAGHAACASCHAADFGARRPTICGACHVATEPWRKLLADAPPPPSTEFGAELDHTRHAQPCASCHALRTASAELRPPRGHAACSRAGCHAVANGPAPHLGECTSCHRLGLVDARRASRAKDPWSTRGAFEHSAHVRDGSGAELACAACHATLTGDVVALPAPAKATCAPCHDGAHAFSLTGTGCTRCHATGAKP